MSTDIREDRLWISSWDFGMQEPGMRYAVHRTGQRVVPFRTVTEAKAWVTEQYGPVKWVKSTVRDGRRMRTDYHPA